MDAYKAVQQKDDKVKALQARRQRLSSMLTEENELFHVRSSFNIIYLVISYAVVTNLAYPK